MSGLTNDWHYGTRLQKVELINTMAKITTMKNGRFIYY